MCSSDLTSYEAAQNRAEEARDKLYDSQAALAAAKRHEQIAAANTGYQSAEAREARNRSIDLAKVTAKRDDQWKQKELDLKERQLDIEAKKAEDIGEWYKSKSAGIAGLSVKDRAKIMDNATKIVDNMLKSPEMISQTIGMEPAELESYRNRLIDEQIQLEMNGQRGTKSNLNGSIMGATPMTEQQWNQAGFIKHKA